MRKVFLIFLALILNFSAKGQEVNLPQYLNYMGENPFMITPAYVGIGTGFRLRMNGLAQWLGIENAPNTQLLSIESRLAERFGGGLVVFNDANGFTSQQGFKTTLASHLILSEIRKSFLSFGLTYSLVAFDINTSNFEDIDAGIGSERNFTTSNFDISMLYRLSGYTFSLIASNVLNKEDRFFSNGEPLVLRRYSVYNSYVFGEAYGDFEVEPSILFQYFESDKRSRTDIILKVRKKISDGYLWAGFTYNFLNDQRLTPNTLAPLIGMKSGNFYASYGFGINFNNTQNFNIGSHLLTIGFDFKRQESLARCTEKYYMFQ